MFLNRKQIFCFNTESSESFNRTPLQFSHSIYSKLSLNKSAVLASKVFKKRISIKFCFSTCSALLIDTSGKNSKSEPKRVFCFVLIIFKLLPHLKAID